MRQAPSNPLLGSVYTPQRAWIVGLLATGPLLFSTQALAHSFGKTFTLPVPFWMYAWASTATLVVTFLLMMARGLLGRTELVVHQFKGQYEFESTDRRGYLSIVVGTLSVLLFVLAVVSGLVGTQRRSDNFNMTYFWIVWMLGLAYLSGLSGDLWRHINPFRAMYQLGEVALKMAKGTRYNPPQPMPIPDFLLYGLAMVWLLAFGAYELFGQSRPKDLSIYMLVYLAYILAGGLLFGIERFCERACFLTIYFELLGRCGRSIRKLIGANPTQADLHTPLRHPMLVVFILSMFAITALDGLLDTEWWATTVWPYFVQQVAELLRPELLPHLNNPLLIQQQLGPLFKRFEMAMLVLAPLAMVLVFWSTVGLASLITQARPTVWQLCTAFAPSLVPILLVYSFSHYFTLLLTQGVQIVHLLSDPMGWGWNLLGTAQLWRAPVLLDAELIWNIQLGSILAGHVASAMLSHDQAFKLFLSRKQANLSQLPLLGLMIGLTLLGLWMLSQPVQLGA